jgi:micrococcal nuclease
MKKRLLTKKQQRQLTALGVGLLLSVSFWIAERQGWIASTTPINSPGTYRVVSIEDGDTITVDMNKTIERIRFIGVDTPETQDPRVPVQCFGKAATTFTTSLIGNNPVRLEADSLNTNRDRYSRLLRYVYLPDGRLVNEEIIKAGYGFAYTLFPFEKLATFRDLERQAREQNIGLWAVCNVNEQDDRRTTDPV